MRRSCSRFHSDCFVTGSDGSRLFMLNGRKFVSFCSRIGGEFVSVSIKRSVAGLCTRGFAVSSGSAV